MNQCWSGFRISSQHTSWTVSVCQTFKYSFFDSCGEPGKWCCESKSWHISPTESITTASNSISVYDSCDWQWWYKTVMLQVGHFSKRQNIVLLFTTLSLLLNPPPKKNLFYSSIDEDFRLRLMSNSYMQRLEIWNLRTVFIWFFSQCRNWLSVTVSPQIP